MKNCIVKRNGHEEEFDERKVYASCYAACLSTKMKAEKAEKICEKVSGKIKTLIKNKKTISSDTIFSQAGKHLEQHNKEAAFMYQTHRDIS
jgi:transcriptional regulator NrdR family protein